jgi:hypothetical protein
MLRCQDQSQCSVVGCAGRRCLYIADGVELARQMLQCGMSSHKMAWLLLIAQFGKEAGGALCSTPPSAAWVLGLAAAR